LVLRNPASSDLAVALAHHQSQATCLRLSKQLLDATWGQTELNFQQDLQKLSNWAQTFDLFSQQQALDWGGHETQVFELSAFIEGGLQEHVHF
jgi:hypothetical protein